ncbi:MAG TPA: ribonuclease P protein component [Burkholderiaceae bacterium]|nr:ribonuclease P protein component [Burkholderiaceae bacterium]
MRGAPRGESASRSEPRRAPKQPGRALARSERLRTPRQFAALAGDRATWRAVRQWVAVTARVEPRTAESEPEFSARESRDTVEQSASATQLAPNGPGLRFGFTVGRRQARRAVQRTLVKRVLREAARHAAGTLRPLAQGVGLDIVLRLRNPLPKPTEMSLSQLKRSIRAEADSLLGQLARHLRSAHSGADGGSTGAHRPEPGGSAADHQDRIG